MAAAIAKFSHALELAQRRNDQIGQARSLTVLGSAQLKNFQYRAALDSLEKAVQIAERISNDQIAGAATGNIASIYSVVGDWPSAEAEAARAVAFLRKVQNPDEHGKPLLAMALQTHASICFHLDRYTEGYKDSDEAIRRAESLGNARLQALMWDVRGAALMLQFKIPEADKALNKALVLSEEIHDEEDQAFVKEHLAELELKKPHPDFHLALRLVDAALASNAPTFKSGRQYYPIHIRARILLGMGDKTAALSEFMHAVSIADQWRLGALPGDTTNTQTVAALQEVYADYAQLAAELALENRDNTLAAKALEVLADNRAASLREQLRLVYGANWKLPDEYFFKLSQLQSAQAEVTFGRNRGEDQAQLTRIRLEVSSLENQFGIKPEKVPVPEERIPRRNSLRDIQRSMRRDQVLISISVGKERSYLWAVTGERVSLLRIPAESELQSKASAFASAVRTGNDSTHPALELSRALFAGLPADVWDRSEWLITADGALLSGVPFCALPGLAGPNAQQPLIASRSLRFLPSELLLLDRKPARLTKNFIGVGDPIYNQADARLTRPALADGKTVSTGITLARLPGSNKEVRSAAQGFQSPDPVLLTGMDATREKLTSALTGQPGILHFAVHVVSPPDQPQQAALALSVRNGMPELLTPEVVASFHTPGSLVVLSGCSSGQGKVVPGVGLVGLSRAWLLAGAAAVIVSNWPTPDNSGKFFSSFYAHFDAIKSGDTAQRAALALRRTQMDMQHGSGYQASPAFWSAFSVISKE